MQIPKLCECGCGQLAPLRQNSCPKRGWVKGDPMRFIKSHNKPHLSLTEESNAYRLSQLRAALKTPEFRQKQRVLRTARMSDPMFRSVALAAFHKDGSAKKQAWWRDLTPEKRAAMAAARSRGQRKRWDAMSREEKLLATAAGRAASVAPVKAKWAAMSTEERYTYLRPVWQASQTANPSSIEEKVAHLLDVLGVKYSRQVFIGRHLVDFYIKSKKLVIECDGSYWHSLPGRPEADAKRDAWFESKGFTMLRLPEAEIRSGSVMDRLKEIA